MPDSFYSAVLLLHVISAVVLIGSGLHAPLTRGLATNAGSLEELRRALAFSRRATRWNPLAAFALLGTGIYLGSIGWWWQPWFYVALAAWIANLALAAGVVGRCETTLERAAEGADGAVTPAVDALRRAGAWRLGHAAMLANDLAMVYVMYVKPGLIGSVSAVLLANALALGAAAIQIADRRLPSADLPTAGGACRSRRPSARETA